jgi:hypothetical protein
MAHPERSLHPGQVDKLIPPSCGHTDAGSMYFKYLKLIEIHMLNPFYTTLLLCTSHLLGSSDLAYCSAQFVALHAL